MSTPQQKLRLKDLEGLSMANAAKRGKCLEALHRLPLTATAADIDAAVKNIYPPLMDEIIVLGARSITAALRRPTVVPPEVKELARAKRKLEQEQLSQAARTITARVQVGSAVVEYFDKMLVDGKRLGDCSHADLQKEQTRLLNRGHQLMSHAGLLSRLAACLRPNETVRTSANREQIVDIMREHFQTT